MGAFDVLDAVDGNGVDIHGVDGSIGSLDEARSIGTGSEAECAESEFQFGAGTEVDFSGGLGASVQENGHGDDGSFASVNRLDVTQVVGVTIFFLVEEVHPIVESDDGVVLKAFENVGVFPSTAGSDSGNVVGVTVEPDGLQESLESGDIGGDETYSINFHFFL